MNQIKSGSLPALRIACVFIPLALAVLSIASTSLPVAVQNQPFFGIPIMLWLWFIASLVICLVTLFVGLRLSFNDHTIDQHNNDLGQGE